MDLSGNFDQFETAETDESVILTANILIEFKRNSCRNADQFRVVNPSEIIRNLTRSANKRRTPSPPQIPVIDVPKDDLSQSPVQSERLRASTSATLGVNLKKAPSPISSAEPDTLFRDKFASPAIRRKTCKRLEHQEWKLNAQPNCPKSMRLQTKLIIQQNSPSSSSASTSRNPASTLTSKVAKQPLDYINSTSQKLSQVKGKLTETIDKFIEAIDVAEPEESGKPRLVMNKQFAALDPKEHLWICNSCAKYFPAILDLVYHIRESGHIGYHAKIPDGNLPEQQAVDSKKEYSEAEITLPIKTEPSTNTWFSRTTRSSSTSAQPKTFLSR